MVSGSRQTDCGLGLTAEAEIGFISPHPVQDDGELARDRDADPGHAPRPPQSPLQVVRPQVGSDEPTVIPAPYPVQPLQPPPSDQLAWAPVPSIKKVEQCFVAQDGRTILDQPCPYERNEAGEFSFLTRDAGQQVPAGYMVTRNKDGVLRAMSLGNDPTLTSEVTEFGMIAPDPTDAGCFRNNHFKICAWRMPAYETAKQLPGPTTEELFDGIARFFGITG